MALTKINKTKGILEGNKVIDTSTALMPTTATGTPASGYFHSTITGRKPIPRLDKDSKVRMGIDRISVQAVTQLQNEFGPNGEPVFSAVNDLNNQIRFVGSKWLNYNDAWGQKPAADTAIDHYVEITFYGTGLNLLSYNDISGRDWRATVDGGTEGSNLIVQGSSVITARNYNANNIIPVVKGLSLGIHTVKIRNTVANWFYLYGFEILTETTQLKVTPGYAYEAGTLLNPSATEESISYNSGFESGTLGTRGGRVLVYQKIDGTRAKAVTPVNSATAYLTSADHTNEEVSRVYTPMEFAAGRTDDFSGRNTNLWTSSAGAAFTLDDGTTALVATGTSRMISGKYLNAQNTTDAIFFTFVGTGLDLLVSQSGATNSTDIYVDGTNVGSGNISVYGQDVVKKICSGLPYGTHTVKVYTNSATNNYSVAQFIVYQPKKPSLPNGAIELADYNIMADFSASTTNTAEGVSTGVLRKSISREFTYVEGTGGTTSWGTNISSLHTNGWNAFTDRQNAYFEYTFFGTGCDLRFDSNSNRATAATVTLNGLAATTANFPTLTSSVSGITSFSSGVANLVGTATVQGHLVIKTLPLALYTIRVTNPTANLYIVPTAIDIITPIHSAKSSIYFDLQNTLPVGSQSVGDSRKLTDRQLTKKNSAMALGVSSSPTSSSSSYVPVPDMSVTIRTNGNDLRIFYSLLSLNSNVNGLSISQIYVNGVAVGQRKVIVSSTANATETLADTIRISVPAGLHKVDVYWSTNAGTMTASERTLLVEEVD